MQKPETLNMGTHLRVLSESFPLNTNMGLDFFRNLCNVMLKTKVASALEGLAIAYVFKFFEEVDNT